jgi:hypothetical protein
MIKLAPLFCVATLALGAAACSDDDGEAVRDCPSESGSETRSESAPEPASETASAPASGSEAECPSGSASGSGSGEAICDPFGNAADADTTVNVSLTEYAVALDRVSVPAGKVHFAIENAGREVHELVVVRSESVDALPLDDEGLLDEAAVAEGDFIGEVEGFPAGETCDGTFELAAGKHVLLCAIVEEAGDGERSNHLAEGMAVEFTVQ